MIDTMLNIEYKIKARSVFRQTVKLCRGTIKILVDTVHSFLTANAAGSAASLTMG